MTEKTNALEKDLVNADRDLMNALAKVKDANFHALEYRKTVKELEKALSM